MNYPIKFLQQELINVRTGYRLEKKRITEILKTMKSINKLEKEQIIDLLIKYNYDISKLPKLEDLEKPKKTRAEPKEKKPRGQPKTKKEIEPVKTNNKDENLSKVDIKKIKNEVAKELMKLYENLKYTDKKPLFKDMSKLLIEYLKYVDDNTLKKQILKDMRKEYKLLKYTDKEPLFLTMGKFFKSVDDYLDKSIETKNTETKPKKDETISTGKNKSLSRLQLEDMKKKKKQQEEEEIKNLNDYKIFKKPSSDQFIQMKQDFDKDKYKWSLEAFQKGLSVEDVLKYSSLSENDFKLLNAFFTPDSITDDILDYSFFYQYIQSFRNENQTIRILEASGGVGNIILRMLENLSEAGDIKNIKIDFVEVNETFIEIARARLYKYRDIITFHNISLFNFKPDYKFDYIIGNPPYKLPIKPKTIYDVDFFIYCYNLLDEGGRIAFLMSPSSLDLKTETHKKFKEILRKEADTDNRKELIDYNKLFKIDKKFDKNEKGAKAGLTNIETNLYVIDKGYEE